MEIMDKLLLNLQQLDSNDLDFILDQRDEDQFDKAWCSLNELVTETSCPLDLKEIFVKLSGVTNNHEVCSYIVDDFELINKAKELGINSKFLKYLEQSYEQGRVPCVWNS
ncbi:hypothetical protein G3497_22905 [Shewanella baltica]|nr:hypothetical protein [Shewanella baltica]